MSPDSTFSRADRELALLCKAFDERQVVCVPSGLAHVHAKCIDAPLERRLTLAVSFGGSNTKLMLAHVGHRCVEVVDALTMPNPSIPMPWELFFRELLNRSPAAVDYLRTVDQPCIGVSLAVPIRDGVPHHPSKMPTLSGLISRGAVGSDTHHFGLNMTALLVSLGAIEPLVAYNSDGVLAHLGAFFLSDLPLAANTILLVCGTGLACATRDEFILCGMARILPDDDAITAHHATEHGQYQHLIAGKGLWGMMRRSLVKAAEVHNKPELAELAATFSSPSDSVRVRDLAAGASLPMADDVTQRIAQHIALDLLDAGATAMANCALASAYYSYPNLGGSSVELLLEGSIATDPFIIDRMRRRLMAADDRFARLRVATAHTPGPPVDVTLSGAAVLGSHMRTQS